MRPALAERASFSEAIELVGKITGQYPNGGAKAGRSYIGALAQILVQYPRCVALRSADVLRGVARESEFLPTPATLIAWCEKRVAELRCVVDRDEYAAAVHRRMRAAAQEEAALLAARATRPTLQQMRDKYGPNWGIKGEADRVAADVVAARNAAEMQRRQAEIATEWDGDPPTIAGVPISRELAELLGAAHRRPLAAK